MSVVHGYAEKVQNNISKKSQRTTSIAVIKACLLYDERKWKAHTCISLQIFKKTREKKNSKENFRSDFDLFKFCSCWLLRTAATRTWLHCAPHRYYYYYYWATTWFASSFRLFTASELQRAHWLEGEPITVVHSPNACLRILTGRPVSCLHARTPMESLILKTKKNSCAFFLFAFSSCRVFIGHLKPYTIQAVSPQEVHQCTSNGSHLFFLSYVQCKDMLETQREEPIKLWPQLNLCCPTKQTSGVSPPPRKPTSCLREWTELVYI